MYIWQHNNWTSWRYDAAALALPLAAVCSQQGRLYGRLDDLGMAQRDMALLDAITKDVWVLTSAHLRPSTGKSRAS
jgi:hypothetical protein